MSTAGRTPSPSGSTAAGAPTSKDPPGRLGRGLGGLESMIRAREAFRTARGARRRVAGSCHAARPARSSSASTCCSADAGKKRPRVVVLTGPTGVGKTSTSLSLAERLNAEIISADSVQVYRGLDIGSDKVSLVPPPLPPSPTSSVSSNSKAQALLSPPPRPLKLSILAKLPPCPPPSLLCIAPS